MKAKTKISNVSKLVLDSKSIIRHILIYICKEKFVVTPSTGICIPNSDTKCVLKKKKKPSIHRKYFQSLNLQKLEWTFVYNDHLAIICKIYENMNDSINNFDRKVEWRKILYKCW